MIAAPSWHASCVAKAGEGVLLLGPPGSGKSDLALRLLQRGFVLVADDRVMVQDGVASSPDALAGLLEVRGLGVFRLRYEAASRLRLAVSLGGGPLLPERLPEPARHAGLDLPLVIVDAAAASAPERVALALEAAMGRVQSVAGAFA